MKKFGLIISGFGILFAVENAQITIYENGNSFIQENRTINSFDKPSSIVTIENLPKNIQNEHIQLDSDCLDMLSKELHVQSISEIEFLKQYIGKNVKLVRYDKYGEISVEKNGKLISLSNGRLYEIDGMYEFNPPLTPIFDPKDIQFQPSPHLVCNVKNITTPCDVDVSYFVSGLTWKAEYELLVDESNNGTWSAWYVITNNSETPYNNVNVSLVSGTVYQQNTPQPKMMRSLVANSMMDVSSISKTTDYTTFRLHQPIDIRGNSSKHVAFFDGDNIPITRVYFTNHSLRFHSQTSKSDMPIQVKYRFNSSEISDFHIPAGSVNVIETDNQHKTFVGSVNIPLTQTGEPISIHTGSTMDITAKVTIDAVELNRHKSESVVHLQLKNTRDEAVSIHWNEHLSGDWEIVQTSHNYDKLNASEIQFKINVPQQGETHISFTVVFKRN